MLKSVYHIGDPHADYEPVKNEKFCKSIDQVIEEAKKDKPDIIIIPGDIWDRRQKEPYYNSVNDEGLGIRTVKAKLTELSLHTKAILITKGNNAHDDKGSIEKLHQLTPNIYAYEKPVLLALYEEDNEINVLDLLRQNPAELEEIVADDYKPIALVPLIPYPTKELLARNVSIDQTNQEFNVLFDAFIGLIGMISDKFKCPKLLGIHANILGSRLSNGQTLLGQDIIISPVSLRKANADYYALNHIHMYQEIEWNMRYAGGLYNMNWGEIDQKYFIKLQFEDNKLTDIVPIELIASRKMVEVKAQFKNGKFEYDKNIPVGAEVRFKFDVAENETLLISEDLLEEVKTICGQDVRIDKNVVPVQRESRSEAIMQVTTLPEEFLEYAKVIGEVVTEIKEFEEDGKKIEKEVLKSTLAKKLALIESDGIEL